MFSTKSLDKILQIHKNEIRRQISKTTSVTNSDAMVPRLDQAANTQQNEELVNKKLLKLQKYHRSVPSRHRSLRNLSHTVTCLYIGGRLHKFF